MTFRDRLKAAQQRGNLTVADLARWFGRPDPTVRGWVTRGVQPAGGPLDRDEAERLLAGLEKLIRGRRGFPLAGTPRQKIAALAKIKNRLRGAD